MSLWLWPLLIVIIAIVAISYYTTASVTRHLDKQQVLDEGVSEKIKDHVFLFNPVILAYVLAGVFMAIVIFYYAVVYTF